MDRDGIPVMTTSNGAPVDDNQNSQTAGEYGPVLLQDFNFIDKISSFDRERIPERVVHAKGAGAYGYLEVTNDMSKYTKAKLFNGVGKRTPLFTRFSTVGGEKGSADTERDPRGFAVKFYTEDGNYDLVGNNTPIFFIRDPQKFPDFIHTQKRNPQTNLKDPNMFWDFLSLTPESVHQVSFLFSDRGTPDGYRHMHGFGSHTFKWINEKAETFFIKYHFITDAGIKNFTADQAGAIKSSDADYATKDLFDHIASGKSATWTLKVQVMPKNFTADEADKIKSTDADYATRDLFNHIASGKSATWSMKVQIMPEADGYKYKWNIFDVTKVWPHSDYPLIDVGKLVLNRNPDNYFAEVEQSAFAPVHMVPGIEPSLDKMLQGRLFSYADTHRHRLGVNYQQIPVNCPYRTRVVNGQRDGFMVVNGNQGSRRNHEPNSFNVYREEKAYAQAPYKVTGLVQRYAVRHPNDDFAQPGALYRKAMKEVDREHLVSNIVGHLKNAARDIQERQVKIFYKCDPEYGQKVASGLGFPAQKSKL